MYSEDNIFTTLFLVEEDPGNQQVFIFQEQNRGYRETSRTFTHVNENISPRLDLPIEHYECTCRLLRDSPDNPVNTDNLCPPQDFYQQCNWEASPINCFQRPQDQISNNQNWKFAHTCQFGVVQERNIFHCCSVPNMAEEEQVNGRSVSPFHQKCFPPYCDSAGQMDKQAISKMERSDLEDKYIIYADENLTLKKRLRENERQVQRLQTAIARQDKLDKKSGVKMQYDNSRFDSLEAENKHLQAKIKVLKQQLMNHSYIHSKESRIAEEKRERLLRKKEYTSPELSFRDVGHSQSARETKSCSTKGWPSSSRDEHGTCREKISALENMLESQKKKYKARVAQLEKDLATSGKSGTTLNEELSEQSKTISNNVEMIKLQRECKELGDRLELEMDQHMAVVRELEENKVVLKQTVDRAADLQEQLQREREKSRDAQSHITKSVSHTETIRALEEQIRDLQNERKTLKDTNEQLLQLTTGVQSKSDRSLKQQALDLELQLKEKIKQLEEKEECIIKLESLLKDTGRQTPTSVSQKSLNKDNSNEIDQQKKQLCHALMENAQLKKVAQEDETCSSPRLVDDNPQERSAKVKFVSSKEDERYFSPRSVTSSSSKSSRPISTASSTQKYTTSESRPNSSVPTQELLSINVILQQQLDEVVAQSKEEKQELECKLHKSLQDVEDLKRELEKMATVVSKASSKKDCEDNELKAQLCSALIENQRLQMALEATQGGDSRGENVKMKQKLADTLAELEELRRIAADHKHCSKSKPNTPATSPATSSYKTVTAQSPIASSHSVHTVPLQTDSKSKPNTPATSPIASSHSAVTVPSQIGPGTKPSSLKSYSSHAVEEVPPEPIQKPVLVIVSKHEFDSVLLKKKKYYSESEVVVPTQESETLNCRLEICIYDLEMDKRMLDHLLDIDNDPRIFVVWDFVGLQQRTASMPAKQAHFHTNVTYYGPVSKNMVDYVKESEVPVYLMLQQPNNKGEQVAAGCLDLMPAIDHPSQGFVRCINLTSSKGSATVYCSFKLHTCCQGEEIPKGESLEIGIGHLKLNNPDVLASSGATHLYVEYSLLGHCGPDLETDSKPKADVVRFNYTKRLNINDHNANSLQPLLQERDPQPLKFILLSEPCNLTQNTEVQELGYAEINLVEEMVRKDQDVISAQLPVFDKSGEHLGSLSVTVIGLDTLQNRMGNKQRS